MLHHSTTPSKHQLTIIINQGFSHPSEVIIAIDPLILDLLIVFVTQKSGDMRENPEFDLFVPRKTT
jgi:hypothetical protein